MVNLLFSCIGPGCGSSPTCRNYFDQIFIDIGIFDQEEVVNLHHTLV